jgi:hypothetical protein
MGSSIRQQTVGQDPLGIIGSACQSFKNLVNRERIIVLACGRGSHQLWCSASAQDKIQPATSDLNLSR